jgi:hypothetical protein
VQEATHAATEWAEEMHLANGKASFSFNSKAFVVIPLTLQVN